MSKITGLGLIGKKLGMTRVFDIETGEAIPVTVILAGPCKVTLLRTKEKDGYNAIQLGFEEKEKYIKDKTVKSYRILKEFRVSAQELGKYKVGDTVGVELFEGIEYVDITGTSKGRGFAGVMARWSFGGGPDSHGSSVWHRRPGSIGQHTFPGKVWKGKKMPGHWGNEKITVLNLKIVKIDKENNLIFVKGAVPGPKNGIVFIRKAIRKYNPLEVK